MEVQFSPYMNDYRRARLFNKNNGAYSEVLACDVGPVFHPRLAGYWTWRPVRRCHFLRSPNPSGETLSLIRSVTVPSELSWARSERGPLGRRLCAAATAVVQCKLSRAESAFAPLGSLSFNFNVARRWPSSRPGEARSPVVLWHTAFHERAPMWE